MAKFHPSKLNTEEKRQLFTQLCYVLAETKNIDEAAELLRDLLTEQEVEMISKRLKVADLLLEGYTYQKIKETLKVSDSKIARVHEWLKLAGEGLRAAKEKLKKYKESAREKIENIYNPFSLRNLKRKYPMYYWPQIVLNEIVKNSNKKQKEKIRAVLNQIKEKTQLYKELDRLLKV